MSTNLKSSEIFDVSKNNQNLLNKIRSVVPFLSAKELPGRHGRDQKPRIKGEDMDGTEQCKILIFMRQDAF
jgi:hypothetical protein